MPLLEARSFAVLTTADELPDVLVLPAPAGSTATSSSSPMSTRSSRGWHHHYDRFAGGDSFVRDPSSLIRFDESFPETYLVERLSGIRIPRTG